MQATVYIQAESAAMQLGCAVAFAILSLWTFYISLILKIYLSYLTISVHFLVVQVLFLVNLKLDLFSFLFLLHPV